MKQFFKFLLYVLTGFIIVMIGLKLLGKDVPEEEEIEDEE